VSDEKTSVTWNGQEVHGRFKRPAVAALAVAGGIVAACAGIAVTVLGFLLLVALSPAIAIVHFALRAMGRNGFVTWGEDGSFSLEVPGHGFEKKEAG
jgi:Zn-dependent protease